MKCFYMIKELKKTQTLDDLKKIKQHQSASPHESIFLFLQQGKMTKRKPGGSMKGKKL